MDEASELLGIPRPTLYRYLREYSIDHVRRSGRIFIPEESLAKIRDVRDLHREGMGTGSVRRALRDRESRTSEDSRISHRLEKLSSELEGLKIEPLRKNEDLSSAQALRTILARQSLLISAVFNLTEMVEEMLRSTGYQPRRSALDALKDAESENRESLVSLVRESEPPGQSLPEVMVTTPKVPSDRERSHRRQPSLSEFEKRPAVRLSPPPTRNGHREAALERRGGFGTLARKRRRNSIMFAALVLAGCALLLVYALWFA